MLPKKFLTVEDAILVAEIELAKRAFAAFTYDVINKQGEVVRLSWQQPSRGTFSHKTSP